MSESLQLSLVANAFYPLVLIAEEDADTRLMLKYLLEIWNYQVIEAKNADETFKMAIHYRPDLILMNVRLPETDGLTATKRIREVSMPEQAVIIFISASSNQSVRAAALAVGGDDYLVKPIDFGALEEKLEKHLRKNLKRRGTFVSQTL